VGVEFLVNVEHAITGAVLVLGVANFNEIVVPPEFLVGLNARQEFTTGPEKCYTGNCNG
jgi:hypothetical protein